MTNNIVTVDARCLSHSNRDGIFNFLFDALKFIVPKRRDLKFILLSNRPFNPIVKTQLGRIENIAFYEDLKSINNSHLWFILKLPAIIRRLKPKWHWSPAVTFPLFLPKETRKLITVHDMVYHDFRKTMNFKTKLSNIFFHDYSIRNADKIWSVSEYTKNRIIERYKKIKCNDIVVGAGIDFSKYKNIDQRRKNEKKESLEITDNFALFVGTMEPRKNLIFLLHLWNRRNDDLNLIVVGASGWKMNNEISAMINSESFRSNKIHFLGFIDDDKLLNLYKTCRLFISTSLNEGFGLPMLEALAFGKPVIASNNSAIAEVVGKNGELINTWNVNDWNKGIDYLLYKTPEINFNDLKRKFDWNIINTYLAKVLWLKK